MLNTTNYFQKVSNIDWDNVPEALAKGHRLVEGASQDDWSPYRTNENIKRVVDAYMLKLDEYMVQNPVKPIVVSLVNKHSQEKADWKPKDIPSGERRI